MGQTYQSIVINTPVDEVWSAVRNFHDMSWASNVVFRVEAVGETQGDGVGAQRLLNAAYRETLLELDDAARSFAYSIDDGPSPVSRTEVGNYVCRASFRPVTEDGSTFVEWSSTWEGNDEAVSKFFSNIYVALLRGMKNSLEGGSKGSRLKLVAE